MSVNPYLFFSGNCREALTRYHEIFGGQLDLMPMSDMPAADGPVPADQADLIMHAALSFDGNLLMASDDPTGDGEPAKGVAVSYAVADAAAAERVFDGLSEGGQVAMPLSETFWSPKFGMCVDRFGISWMVGVEPATS